MRKFVILFVLLVAGYAAWAWYFSNPLVTGSLKAPERAAWRVTSRVADGVNQSSHICSS